jgi:dipeptidyl aminopeptidase/acylaminoacyl peptidase
MVPRSWRRRSVFAGALLPALAVALMPAGDAPGSDGRAAPSIPDRMAGYSHLTADVSSSPPGRGVALFQFGFGVEFLDFPQAVVVGADGDVYRRVDLAEERVGAGSQGDPAPMLLSPDGTRVAVGAHDAEQPELAVLELASGRVETHSVPVGRSVLPVAWSPDGRRLAYLGNAEATNPHAGTGPISGDVGLLDVPSGETTRLDGATDVWTVAFAPDGQELAVQHAGGALDVLPLDGGASRTLAPRPGFQLAGPGSWSPDGALLAAWRTSSTCPGLGWNPSPACAADEVVSFVDATGGGASTPAPLIRGVVGPGHVLGWTAADRVAVLVPDPVVDSGDPEEHRVVDVPLDGGEPRQLSALPTSGGKYGVSRFHVATGLLPDLEMRESGDADRGRWPLWLRLGAALAVGGAVAGTASLVTRHATRAAA